MVIVIIGKKKYEELIKRIERLEKIKKPTKSEDERMTPAKVIDEWLNGKRKQ